MKVIALFFLLFNFVLFGQKSYSDNPNYTLIWGDEFNVTTLNTGIWDIKNGQLLLQSSKYSPNVITSNSKNISVGNGNEYLKLSTYFENTPNTTGKATVGELQSKSLFYPDVFFECRYILPQGNHTSCSFWLWEGDGTCNGANGGDYREIDILEWTGSTNKSTQNIHYCWNGIRTRNADEINHGNLYYGIPNPFTEPHISQARLSHNNIYLYLDNILFRKVPLWKPEFKNGMRLVINNWVDFENFNPSPNPNSPYAEFLVEYIRVYQLKKNCSEVVNDINFNNYNFSVKKSISINNQNNMSPNTTLYLLATDFIELKNGFESKNTTILDLGIIECDP